MRFTAWGTVLLLVWVCNAAAQEARLSVEPGQKTGDARFILSTSASYDFLFCLMVNVREEAPGALVVAVRPQDCAKTQNGRAAWTLRVPRHEWLKVHTVNFAILPTEDGKPVPNPKTVRFLVDKDGKAREVVESEQNI